MGGVCGAKWQNGQQRYHGQVYSTALKRVMTVAESLHLQFP